MYVIDSLLKHFLTRDKSIVLIRSCGKEVYKVENSKEDTLEPLKIQSLSFSIIFSEILWTKIIDIASEKAAIQHS